MILCAVIIIIFINYYLKVKFRQLQQLCRLTDYDYIGCCYSDYCSAVSDQSV